MKRFALKFLILLCLCSMAKAQVWEHIYTDLVNTRIYSLSQRDSTIYYGTSSGWIYIGNTNGAERVEKRIINVAAGINFVEKHDTLLYVATNGQGIYISSDNGDVWAQKNSGLPNWVIETLLIEDDMIHAATGNGLYVSADKGDTWSTNNNSILYAYSLVKSGNNILTGTSNSLYISKDNGVSWTEKNVGVHSGSEYSLATNNGNMVYLTRGNTMYISADNGETWNEAKGMILKKHIYSVVANGTLVFAALADKGVYMSTDNGSTWAECNNGISDLSIEFLAKSGNTIIAGTANGSVWKTDISSLISSADDYTENTTVTTIRVYPNPVSENLTIAWNEPSEFETGFSIINDIGEHILLGSIPSGTSSKTINTEQLSSGTYTLLLYVKGQNTCHTFSVVK